MLRATLSWSSLRSSSFATLLLATIWTSSAVLLDEDIVTTVPGTPFPANTVLCPGDYWTVAVTTFGVHRGTFGKARANHAGGVQAYFPYEGRERMDAQSMDLLQLPFGDSRNYIWVGVDEYRKRSEHFRPVKKDKTTPFAYYHPGDGGTWQLGKLDLQEMVGSYTLGGRMIEVRAEAVEKGRMLVANMKEDAGRGRKQRNHLKQLILVGVALMLNILAISLIVPFLPEQILAKFLRKLRERFARVSPGSPVYPPQQRQQRSQSIPREQELGPLRSNQRERAQAENILEEAGAAPQLWRMQQSIEVAKLVARPQDRTDKHCKDLQEKDKVLEDESASSSTSPGPGSEAAMIDNGHFLDVQFTSNVIGWGTFGTVEKGVWGDKKVAVKFVNPMCGHDAVSTIEHEVKILGRIPDHENVVKCHGRCMHAKKGMGLVEELMEMSLDDWVRAENFRANTLVSSVLDAFVGIARGLEHLHKHGIVHYDLKPKNILLDRRNTAKVADFGCSKIKAQSYITAGFAGTVAYLAPECLLSVYCNMRGKVRAEKIDVFSFGVVMWESLVGSTPLRPGANLDFEISNYSKVSNSMGGSSQDVTRSECSSSTHSLNDCLMAKFPMNTSCPEELRTLVANCMQIDNRSRPRCSEVRRRLEQLRDAPWASRTVSQVLG